MTGAGGEESRLAGWLRRPSRGAAVVALLLLAFGVVNWMRVAVREGADFAVFHVAAGRYVRGENPYLASGRAADLGAALRGGPPVVVIPYGYFPLNTALLAPFGALPKAAAQFLWALLTLGALAGGLWLLMAAAMSEWSGSSRLLVLAVLLNAVSVRWVFAGQLQVTTLVIGALGGMVWADRRGRLELLLAFGLLASLKPTLFLPALVLLLFRGRARLAVVLLLLAAGLNLLAALPTGLAETAQGYRLVIGNFAGLGSNNHPDAHDSLRPYLGLELAPMQTLPGTAYDGPLGFVGEQLHWTYLFSAWMPGDGRAVERASVLSGVCTLAAFAVLAVLWACSRGARGDLEFGERAFSAGVALSLLSVYHQRYDSAAMLLPLALSLAHLVRRAWRWDGLLFALALLVTHLVVSGAWAALMGRVVAPTGWLPLAPVRGCLLTAFLVVALAGAFRRARVLGETPADGVIGRAKG